MDLVVPADAVVEVARRVKAARAVATALAREVRDALGNRIVINALLHSQRSTQPLRLHGVVTGCSERWKRRNRTFPKIAAGNLPRTLHDAFSAVVDDLTRSGRTAHPDQPLLRVRQVTDVI